jgi:hypothetical protein
LGNQQHQNQHQGSDRDGDERPVTRAGFIEKYGPIVRSGYRADFSRDTRVKPPVFHYVISLDGSREILAFSQANSLQEARAQARKEIDTLASRRKADSATDAAG